MTATFNADLHVRLHVNMYTHNGCDFPVTTCIVFEISTMDSVFSIDFSFIGSIKDALAMCHSMNAKYYQYIPFRLHFQQ